MAFLALSFILILWNCHALVVSLNEEGLALLAFKGSLTAYPEGCFDNWSESDQTPCSWLGVNCRGYKVVSLAFPNKSISGTLSADIGRLSALRHLNLRQNNLSGVLPQEIGKLNSLSSLDLSQNSFSGSITQSLVQCKRLKTILLNGNFFSGPLPSGLGTSFTHLQTLNLSSNRLNGSIPGSLGDLSTLTSTLDLSHNLFSGLIPSSLGKLPQTLYINLSFNNLSGPIPETDTLLNLGPPAFLGNPFLCGPPLENLCSSSNSFRPSIPGPTLNRDGNSGSNGGNHYNLGILIAIVIGILAGTFMIGWLFSYSCKNIKRNKRIGGCNFEETSIVRKDIFCFANDVSEPLSESVEQYKFVRLDQKVNFNVDQLLTASAYLLGKSGLGIIYKVVLENGLTLAVRRLGSGGGSQRFREFQNEVEAIGKIKHPNILALKAYCWSIDEKLLIYNYIPNGDLATAIHGKPGVVFFTPLSWPVRLGIMKGIAKGLTHLHECSQKKYVHGNLKPSKILLGLNMEPQISDLGLCRLANKSGESPSSNSDQTTSETPPQSLPYELISATSSPAAALGLHYKAPEVSSLRKPTQKWDVYSFGVIVLEMISGKSPLVQVESAEMDIVRWFQLVIEQARPFHDVLDPFLAHDLDMQDEIIGALKIALSCVHKNPEKRPSMKHVCELLARLA